MLMLVKNLIDYFVVECGLMRLMQHLMIFAFLCSLAAQGVHADPILFGPGMMPQSYFDL